MADKLVLKVGDRRIELASPFVEYHSDMPMYSIANGMVMPKAAMRLPSGTFAPPGVTAIATIPEKDFFQALFDHFPGMIAGYKAHLRGEIDSAWETYNRTRDKALEACQARVDECESILATLEGDE